MPRFEKYYKQIVCQDILYKQNINNIMELSNLSQITISTNLTVASLFALEMICHQKSKPTRAAQPLANFKIRKNQLIGCLITLRNRNLFHFLEKLSLLLLPKSREWKELKVASWSLQNTPALPGVSNRVREKKTKNNYVHFGLTNLLLFSELEGQYDFFESISGLNITISIPKDGGWVLSGFQFPIKKR